MEQKRKKYGGRKAGTPNKVTSSLREWLKNIIDDNRKQFEHDLQTLQPRERIVMLEKLLAYCLPKCHEEEIPGSGYDYCYEKAMEHINDVIKENHLAD